MGLFKVFIKNWTSFIFDLDPSFKIYLKKSLMVSGSEPGPPHTWWAPQNPKKLAECVLKQKGADGFFYTNQTQNPLHLHSHIVNKSKTQTILFFIFQRINRTKKVMDDSIMLSMFGL